MTLLFYKIQNLVSYTPQDISFTKICVSHNKAERNRTVLGEKTTQIALLLVSISEKQRNQ